MTTIDGIAQAKALRVLAEEHDIPDSYYELAKARYESLGSWLSEKSDVADYDPVIYPQGSFRYGTVKPAERDFDLDLVCELRALSKPEQTQANVKELVGKAIKAYAVAHGMKREPEESNRCWALLYAEDDGLRFHIDVLPSLPEEESVKAALATTEAAELARFAIVFTDRRDTSYHQFSQKWPMSNPEGFARWFESRMRDAAFVMLRKQVEEIPPHRWNTPLQIAIRILKHHRDVMFGEYREEVKPSSVIITTLAARAYGGETDLSGAILSIVERMPTCIVNGEVRNPANPEENFTEKWDKHPERRNAFSQWYGELVRNLDSLGQNISTKSKRELLRTSFGVDVDEERFGLPASAPAIIVAHTTERPEPWAEP
jgi:hypothetical protein